jgi:hypothetical protein
LLIPALVIISIFACKKKETIAESEPIVIPAACEDTTRYTYEANVQSILIAHCSDAGCHNATTAKEGLNVHNYTSVKNSINKTSSNFLRRIKRESGVNPMPPTGSNKSTLSATQVGLIACWIQNGLIEN